MKQRILFAAVIFLLPTTCKARGGSAFPAAWYVPFDRLIDNTQAFIREYPNNPQGYYTLGRMHYFTFVNRMALVPTRKPDGFPPDNVAREWQAEDLLSKLRHDEAMRVVLEAWGYATRGEVPTMRWSAFDLAVRDKEQELKNQGWEPEYVETDKALAHAGAAADNFERALDLDPNNGLFYLSLAGLYEDYLACAADANITDHPRQLACINLPRIRVTYYLAYRFSIEGDRKRTSKPSWGLQELVSYEAGAAYLRLATEEPAIVEAGPVAQVKADLAYLDALPKGSIPITPIVFSVASQESVLDLLDPNTHVTFDLDGAGRGLQWPWLKPSTGLLVWDPLNKGEITSGRQLFGSATWWLLFPTGYATLDALDDSRDGTLSGSELKGIGVWFDKNSNGRSEPGEVQPATDFGIQAIRTRSTGSDHGMPMNAQGIVMKDGRTRPTYDWIVSPLR